MQQDRYQIFYNHHPLSNQTFNTLKSARSALKDMYLLLSDYAPSLGYKVQKRSSFTRNVLGIKRIYLDGYEVCDTYLIQHVILQSTIVNF